MVTYEKEFKEQAVKMAAEIGATKAAQDLGIHVNTLYTWISRSKAHGEYAHVGSGNRRQNMGNDEITRLIKRNKEYMRSGLIESRYLFIRISASGGDISGLHLRKYRQMQIAMV